MVTDAITGWLERRPHLGTELGLRAYDGRLAPMTAATLAADRRWLQGLAARLETISPQNLSAERRADRERLADWIEHQRFVLEVMEPHAHDPAHVLPVIEGSVRSLLESDALAPCDRVRAIAARLTRVPEVVRAARVMLREPSRPAVLAALAGVGETLDFLRITVPALTRDCREPVLQGDLAEADSAAVRALEEYRVALREDLLPRAVEPRPLGAEALSRLLRVAERETGEPDSLLIHTGREIEARRARLEELAERIAPGRGVAGATAALEEDAIPEGQLPRAIGIELDSLRARTLRRGIVTLPAAKELEVRWTLVPGRDRPAVRLLTSGPFDRVRRRARLVYESAGATASPAGLEARQALLHRAALPLALASEAIPGRWPFEVARRAASRVRKAFPAASATHGWSAYAERLATGSGGAGDARTEFVAEQRALERLARAAAALELHLGPVRDEDVAARLAARTGMHPENALRAVTAARTDPVGAIAPVLGAWRIAALRDALRERQGARFSPRRFHDALLAQGPLPLPLAESGVRRAMERRAVR